MDVPTRLAEDEKRRHVCYPRRRRCTSPKDGTHLSGPSGRSLLTPRCPTGPLVTCCHHAASQLNIRSPRVTTHADFDSLCFARARAHVLPWPVARGASRIFLPRFSPLRRQRTPRGLTTLLPRPCPPPLHTVCHDARPWDDDGMVKPSWIWAVMPCGGHGPSRDIIQILTPWAAVGILIAVR